jgi:hypothetical protein
MKTAFVFEGAASSPRSVEDKLVLQYARDHQLHVDYASIRQVRSGRVRFAPHQVPVGGIPFVRAVAQQAQLVGLEQSCYPASLRPFLHRTLTSESLRTVIARLETGRPAVFIKPAERTKRFTGFVMDDPQDYRVAGVSKALQVWVSSPVQWLSEWRAYVVNHQLRHLSFYAGSQRLEPDPRVLAEMVSRYADAGAPDGYAMDVGVLNWPGGEVTSLVEVNEGFSVGAYEDVPRDAYAEMLVAYWLGLATDRPVSPGS